MNPIERILNALTESGNEPKRNGSGWQACCPAHEDRSPSLSINEGNDGRVLVKCFTGCTVEAVCAAAGLKVADLMPTTDTLPRPTMGNRSRKPSKPKGQSKDGKSYATASEAVAALERGLGKRSNLWTYHNATGEPVGVVVRWNRSDGKTIRQASRRSDGRWIPKAMPNPRPLYRLPTLTVVENDTARPTVYVVEGEKAADALVTLGLTVTTSAGGGNAAKQTDWKPLAGRDVVLLPDNDKAGTKYRNDVLDLLSALEPQPTVRVVELPGLPEKGDAFDWIASGGTREELEKLAEATESEALPVSDEPLRWRPFPVETLPKLLADFVHAAAKSRVVDPAMVAMPLLVALAGAIGGTRRVLIKPDWGEPCIVWGALVAPSGSGKTPAATPVLQAVRDRDATAALTNKRLLSEHQDALKQHEVDRKKAKESEPLREKPERPPSVRYHLQDVTPEQLMAVLADNPRGVLLVRDELSALFGGFGRYSDGKGAVERGKYLTIWSADHLSDDRKVAQSEYVRRPHVSIYGGIQPDVLFKSLGNDDLAAGLPARFLFAWPPERSRRWSDTSVPHRLTDGVAAVFDRLFGLAMAEKMTTDAHGFEHTEYMATDVPFTAEARQTFRQWVNAVHAPLLEDADGALRAAYAKLPGYVGRLALVLQLSRWATGEEASGEQVDNESVLRAIRLVEWFANEAARVYQLHAETDTDRELRQLAEWIGRKGGRVTARELSRGPRRYRGSGVAETLLQSLVTAGYGKWHLSNHGGGRGQPTRYFQLFNSGDGDTNTLNPEGNPITVTVATDTRSVSSSEPEPFNDDPDDEPDADNPLDDNDWGEL